MTKIDELQKAIDEAAMTGVLMIRKSQMSFDFTAPNPHHVAYTRTNASGTVSNIQAKGVPTGYEYHQKKAAEASAKAVDSASHTAAASAHMEAILQAGHGSKEASFHEEAYKHHMKMATALPAANAPKQKVWGGTDSADGKFRFRDWETGDEVPNYEGEYTYFSKDGGKSQMHTWMDKYGERNHSHMTKDEYNAKYGEDFGRTTPHKVGDNVHLGFGTKGGAGYYGKLTKIDGETAYVTNDEGRTFKGHISKLSAGKEAATDESQAHDGSRRS